MYYLNSRYYNPEWGRFINADIGVSNVGELKGYNMYEYSFNNPINMEDSNGMWPKWVNNIIGTVAVIGTLAVVATVTVATAGTGTIAATIAIGALKGAVIGSATGAAVISHTINTGSLEGVGEVVLNEGSTGALSGAVTGAITGAVTSIQKVINVAKAWDKGTQTSSIKSLNYHYKKHVLKEGGIAKNIFEYTDDAINFSNKNKSLLKYTKNYKYNNYSWNKSYTNGAGGQFTSAGNILTFWYK